MSDDMIEKGERIERLLQNADLKEHLDSVEATATERWKRAKTLEEREQEHALIKATEQLRTSFKKTIDSGKMLAAGKGPRSVR